jgi:hypothetical protein
METNLTISSWSATQKILFRFVFVYFGLLILIQNNGAFPFWEYVLQWLEAPMHIFIPWVGKNILHLSYDITVFTNGSGDTTYDYVIIFTIFSIALTSTLVWSLLDRNRANYQTLYYWLTVAVRFYVGLMLVSYGMVKVFKLQFPAPGLSRLTQFYGDSSPMGLAWTFLGFSKGYNMFMGVAEVLAVLLLFRRTMTVGAIITLMAAANVMAVNYFYDVPVKILSTHLVLMTLFLLLHDAQKLLKFFFTNAPVQLQVIAPPSYPKKWIRTTGIVFKILIIGFSLLYGGYQSAQALKEYGDDAPKTKFYGLYNVKKFIYKKDTLTPLITDTLRWRQLSLEWESFARVRMMNDSINRFILKTDTTLQTMQFTNRNDTLQRFNFSYRFVDKKQLQLTGTYKGDSLSILFDRPDVSTAFRLTKRGFHWVNEYPYNR